MKHLKLSNIWENFDDFLLLCENGNNQTKYELKFIKTYFDENGFFDFDWNILLQKIILIYVNDKRLAKKFDYTDVQLMTFQQKFSQKFSSDYKTTFEYLFDKLNNQFYNGVQWGAPTKHYEESNTIYLTKQLPVEVICKITVNKMDLTKFYITVGKNKILLVYEDGQYKKSINLETGVQTQISKYPEILHFINAKYFNLYIDNLSYNTFKYLALSFCGSGTIYLPANNNGFLRSVMSSSVIDSLESLNKFFEDAEKRYENIRFTYKMTSYNKFEIIREGDESLNKSIEDTENAWGEARSANRSRKGPILDKPKN